METLGDCPLIELEIPGYWNLVTSVAPLFLNSLPRYDQNTQNTNLNRDPSTLHPLIRSALEWIANQLDLQKCLPDLPNLHVDLREEVHRVLREALERLELFVINNIVIDKDPRRKHKFYRLEALQALEHSINDCVTVTITKSSYGKLVGLYMKLQCLIQTMEKAFPKIFSKTSPSPVEDSIEAAQRAQEFGRLAEALFRAISKQLDEDWKERHCEDGRCKHEPCTNKQVGSIKLAMLGKQDVDLFLPLCSQNNDMHPSSCFLHATSQQIKSPGSHPGETRQRNIGPNIRDSYRRKRKLFLQLEDEYLWERESHFERCIPWERVPLSSFIRGYENAECSAYTGSFTNGDRAEIPVLLAHSMLYLYGTPWLQYNWNIDKVLWMIEKGPHSPHKRYPYLECVLSLDDSKRAIEPDFADGKDCDPLYRHLLIWEFGLRLLEIETGSRFPPDLEEDRDPESNRDEPHPFLTLQRALDNFKGKGVVEDEFYEIIEACLDFDVKLEDFKAIEPGLRERVVLHNVIFLPLLQRLTQKFKTAAADLFILERDMKEVYDTSPMIATSRGRSLASRDNDSGQRGRDGLSTIFEEPNVSPEISIIANTPSTDNISDTFASLGRKLTLPPRHSSHSMHH
ncbi:hypothetical protein M434DRAFT_10465 [Hypoxylon sp. CO27-5]|nr:hypothetical protein M434DRAFT_10465 [Hypoxylon sp. CO27-5]